MTDSFGAQIITETKARAPGASLGGTPGAALHRLGAGA